MSRKTKMAVKIQKVVRGFLGRRRASRLRQILEARKQAQAKSFLMSIAEKGLRMFTDLKELQSHDRTQYKQQVPIISRVSICFVVN